MSHLPRIGIVGHSHAGKTAFLAMLKRAFHDQGGWIVVPVRGQRGNTQQSVTAQSTASTDASAPSEQTYLDFLSSFVNKGYFPPKTPIDKNYNRIDLQVSKEGAEAFSLSFFDPAGELFETPPSPFNTAAQQGRLQILEELARCTGMIVLLDSEKSPEILWQTLSNTIDGVRSNLAESSQTSQKLAMRVAVLFTKADLLTWQRRYRVRSAGAWVRNQSRFQNIVKIVEDNCANFQFFFASTVGWTDGLPNIRSVVNFRPFNQAVIFGDHIPDPALNPRVTDDELRAYYDNVVVPGAKRQNPSARVRDLAEIRPQLEAEILKGRDDPNQFRYMQSLSVFTDPLRCVQRDFVKMPLPTEHVGVHTLVGRREPSDKDATNLVRPWNVVEPVLWAADRMTTQGGQPWFTTL